MKRASASFLLFALAFAADSGAYFLSVRQKGQLFVDGVIRDTSGNAYNVRIVPGYASTGTMAARHWKNGTGHQKKGSKDIGGGLVEIPLSLRRLGEYGTTRPYAGVAEGLDQSWRGERYLFGTFMGRDLVNAWSDYLRGAGKAQRRRSFGWWFAYPWAVGKGAVNSTLRVGGGAAASVLVAGYGLLLRPAYEVVRPPALMLYDAGRGLNRFTIGTGLVLWGTGEQIAAGTAAPLLSAAWTTAVAPPMALIGRAPTPRSADGWWVALLPGSPDYLLSLDPDSKLRLRDPEGVFTYEADSYRAKLVSDSLDAEREARVRSLHAEIDATWRRYNALKDSASSDILGSRSPPGEPVVRKLQAGERLYLDSLVRDRLAGNPVYENLEADERAELVDRIVLKWGPRLLATPFGPDKGPYYKSDPASLLREEAEEVFTGESLLPAVK